MTEQMQNFGHTTLNEALDASETGIDVTDGSVFPANGNYRVVVDSEIMLVTSRATNTLTVERGAEGTTAATHSNGADIDARLTSDGLRTMIQENSLASGVIGCMVYNDGAQSVGTSATALTFDSEDWDTDGFHDTGSNTSRITIPAGLGGTYMVTAQTHCFIASANLRTVQAISLNGTTNLVNWESDDTNDAYQSPALSIPLELAAGDYIEFEVNVGTGANADYGHASSREHQSWFSVVKLGSGTVGEAIGVKAYNDGTEAITSATVTGVALDQQDFDTDGFHSTVTNNSRFTVPAGLGGKYLVTGAAMFASNSNGVRIGGFVVNGTNVRPFNYRTPLASNHSVDATQILDLAAGDYVEFGVWQNTGGNLNIGDASNDNQRTTFSMVLLATAGSGALKEGTAFPIGPATGDRYRRTDLDYLVFFYDGTRWRSETIFHTQAVKESDITAAAALYFPAQPDGYDFYVLDWRCIGWVQTTNDGSNYYGASLQRRPEGSATNTTVGGSADTSAGSAGTIIGYGANIDAVVTEAEVGQFRMLYSKTGSPGAHQNVGAMIRYQLVTT